MKVPQISELNILPEDQFVTSCNLLFESAPVLSNLLLKARPFLSYESLIDTAERLILSCNMQDQIEIVNAHPRIGAPAQSLSAISRKEQGAADSNLEQVLAKLEKLNKQYEAKFGFKFVVFVNGRPRSEIVVDLENRMNNTVDQELENGLNAMIIIARNRLHSLK